MGEMMDIKITRLNKAYGEQTVLKNFSACFPGGEITCIMGESGLGKTTLLHIIMGLIPADSGQIEGIQTQKPMGVVFQEDRLLEGFNAVTNIRFAAAKDVSRLEIMAHLEALGLEGSLDKPVSQLSGGMKRRVAIARAILSRAALLFLDEPLKGLDIQTRAQVVHYMKSYIKGKTTLMVTHSPEEAALMGGHVFLMPDRRPIIERPGES
jgi:NitT/TauT family transport system ATP-binding protein